MRAARRMIMQVVNRNMSQTRGVRMEGKRKSVTARVSKTVKDQLDDLKKKGIDSAEVIDQAFYVYNDSDIGIKSLEWLAKNKGINQESKDDVEKKMERSLSWVKVESTRPPNSFIDACILSLYAPSAYQEFEYQTATNLDRKDFLFVDYNSKNLIQYRKQIIHEVQYHIEKEIYGTSWAKVFKGWAKKKGSVIKVVDNRIKSLREQGVITNVPRDTEDAEEGYRGSYRLITVITEDQWKFIEGVTNLPPQRGISIPKLL